MARNRAAGHMLAGLFLFAADARAGEPSRDADLDGLPPAMRRAIRDVRNHQGAAPSFEEPAA